MNNSINPPGFQPPDFSDPNKQYLYIRDTIPNIYLTYINRHGTTFFVQLATMQAISPDSPRTLERIKSYISYAFNQKVSTSTIKEAIKDVKGGTNFFPFTHPLYIRVIDNGSTLYLQQSPERFWCIAHDGKDLKNLPQNPVPHNLPLGSKPHLNPPPSYPYIWRASLRDLPNSVKTFDAQALKKLFSITPLSKDQDLLVLAWLVLTLLPRFEQTALQLIGGPQSGKTWTQNLLTSLIDPHDQTVINPNKKNDIQESLLNCYILSLDDVENLNKDTQALLRECLTTHVHRYPLRSKDPLEIDLRKPVILNCLQPVITQKELRKRTINIDLEADDNINSFSVTDQDISEIFGGLLDLTSQVLDNLRAPWSMDHAPYELYDYCHIGYIVANVLEGSPQRFIDQFHDHQRQKEREQIEENEVAVAVENWIQVNPEGHRQTISGWCRALKLYNPDAINWPDNGKAMSAQLRKAKNPLARAGIDVILEGTQSGNGHCTIRPKK